MKNTTLKRIRQLPEYFDCQKFTLIWETYWLIVYDDDVNTLAIQAKIFFFFFRYRTHDGTCNNLNRPRWGSTMTPVQRFLPPSYSDGLQAPRRSTTGAKLPSAREISSLVHENQDVENHGITHLLMQWGQFLDHDVTSSSQSRGFNGSVPRCCKDGGRDFVPKEFLVSGNRIPWKKLLGIIQPSKNLRI